MIRQSLEQAFEISSIRKTIVRYECMMHVYTHTNENTHTHDEWLVYTKHDLTEKKTHTNRTAVWETGVSRHHGGKVEGYSNIQNLTNFLKLIPTRTETYTIYMNPMNYITA